MILEAVWFKNGKEVATVDPVVSISYGDSIDEIVVYNGLAEYSGKNWDGVPDDFIIRIKKEDILENKNKRFECKDFWCDYRDSKGYCKVKNPQFVGEHCLSRRSTGANM